MNATETHKWNPEDYEKSSSAQYSWAMALISELKLKGDERILDIGSGDGRITAHLAGLVPGGSVLGIDLSPEMVSFAVSRHVDQSNLSFQVGDASRLHFLEQFDLVVSFACLHWIEDQLPVLRSIRRGLAPGGKFLMQCGGRGNAVRILDLTGEIIMSPPWNKYFSGFSFPYHFYGPEEYRPWLEEACLLPRRVDLKAKDMIHQGQAGLEGIIRNTWLPYTQRLPAHLQGQFIKEIAGRYLERYPLDRNGQAHVQMMRLEVEAERPCVCKE
ncbi:MAG: Fibrillarin-like rRNA/tRNA 2'-O-methyltransferase [Methanosaeta sp. PtaU1.Bin112]|nr:MAG: Fibrillarin-like rRNA/tRNA 2'-O-methyltransferase [Methanosaeta sp. PtaU1.Bin112]